MKYSVLLWLCEGNYCHQAEKKIKAEDEDELYRIIGQKYPGSHILNIEVMQ